MKVYSTGVSEDEHDERYRIAIAYGLDRLTRTRFARIGHNGVYVWNWYSIPEGMISDAQRYRPDAVFTVADNVHAGLAAQLAERLAVPLIVNFQDLFPLSHFLQAWEKPYSGMRPWLMNRFRALHRTADLVFYTSEGMRDWFGGHPNGHVLYPIGDDTPPARPAIRRSAGPWTIVYAGNCYGAYGRMLLRLAQESIRTADVKLCIFAAGNDWSERDVKQMKEAGVYYGFIPPDKLRSVFVSADAFLTVMSFEELERPFVCTSFTTKWLDYAPYSRPIFAWAPCYSTAAVFASQTGGGIAITADSASLVLDTMRAVLGNPSRQLQAAEGAAKVATNELSPIRLHSLLVRELHRVCGVAS